MEALELNDSTLEVKEALKKDALTVTYSSDTGTTNPVSIETVAKCTQGGGTCSTASGTAAKTITINTLGGLIEYVTTVYVKFTNANTASSPTLAVTYNGGSSSALPIKLLNGKSVGTLSAGLYKFVYGGDCWLCDSPTVSDSVVDSSDIIVSGKAVNGALEDYGKKYVIKSGTLTIATVKSALGTDGFYFYKSNKADWTRFVSGIYQNGNILNKQGTWKAELSSDGTTIQGNDNNDTWNCIPIALSL